MISHARLALYGSPRPRIHHRGTPAPRRAFEDGQDQEEDEFILQRATVLGRAVFSQDDDFLALAHAWLKQGREFAGVLYAHQMNITIGKAVSDLETIATILEPDEMRNRIEFLPLP